VLETLPCLWNFRIHSGRKFIFQRFSPLMQPRPFKVALPNCRYSTESWQNSCRYVYVFRKLNSINPIGHNLNFCEARSSIPFVKLIFTKTHFTRGMFDLASAKIVIDRVDGIQFSKDVNISTWNFQSFYDTKGHRSLLKNAFPSRMNTTQMEIFLVT
jgi:hypothetical protein